MNRKLKNSFILICSMCLSAAVANDSLFEKYGKIYGVPSVLLYGIAEQESAFNPIAVNKNENGTYDIGLMQINTVHLPMLNKKGLELKDLFSPETNIAVGAFILSDCFKKFGQNWKGLTCYNGKIEGNNYAHKVLSKIMRELKNHEQKMNNVALSH